MSRSSICDIFLKVQLTDKDPTVMLISHSKLDLGGWGLESYSGTCSEQLALGNGLSQRRWILFRSML